MVDLEQLKSQHGHFAKDPMASRGQREDSRTILALIEKLEKAKAALEWYGNPESWILRGKDEWKSTSPKQHGDMEMIRDYVHPGTDWKGTVVVGGKRARECLKELGE